MSATRLIATLVVAALIVLATPARRADACSCIGQAPEQYVKQADLVFFARPGKQRTEGKRTIQPLEVLHTLKGTPGKVYRLSRPRDQISTCDSQFKPGAVALVFINKGAASVCAGNYDLQVVQLEKMADYLRLGTPPAGAPDLDAVRATLEAALLGYLHDRPTVPVNYAPLAGQKARTGKTTLVFGKNRLKHAVDLRQAVTSGPLVFVSGVYGMEGYAFRLLALRKTGPGAKLAYEALARWGAERSRRGAPGPNIGPTLPTIRHPPK